MSKTSNNPTTPMQATTFEQCCQLAGIDPATILNATDAPDEIAFKKIKLIIKVINQGWVPDFKNRYEYKWFVFAHYGARAGLWYAITHYTPAFAFTYIGSRVCFQSEEKAEYFAKHYFDLYKEFLSI